MERFSNIEKVAWAVWRFLRDIASFGLGAKLLLAVADDPANASYWYVAGAFALCGLPFAFARDRRRRRDDEGGSDGE